MTSLLPTTRPRSISGFDSYDAVGSVCARYMIHLFASKRYPYPSPRSQWQATLPSFISSVLRLSGFDATVAIVAVTFLVRYKEAEPHHVAYNKDAFRLFFSAYIVASKVVYDYSPGSLTFWKIVGGDSFSYGEIKMMEVELCRVLDWHFHIDIPLFAWIKNIADHYYFSADITRKPATSRIFDTSPPPSYEDAIRDMNAFIPRIAPSSPGLLSVSSSEEADQIALARTLFQSPELKRDQGDVTSCLSNNGYSFLSSLKKRLFVQ